MDYNFLSNLTLVDTGRLRTPKEVNPTGMTLRVFANGDVYPSKELVKKYKLEYVNRESTEESNGIDVIDSKQWKPTEAFGRTILFGITPKSEAKITLFGSCKFDDNLNPRSSVMNQGSTSEELLTLVKELGLMTEEQKYVDLAIAEEYPITLQDGLAFIPKTIKKGVNAGQPSYERRDSSRFFSVTSVEEYEKMKNTLVTTKEATQVETV